MADDIGKLIQMVEGGPTLDGLYHFESAHRPLEQPSAPTFRRVPLPLLTRSAKLKTRASTRRLFKVFKQWLDIYDVTKQNFGLGLFSRVPNSQLEGHLNSGTDWRHRVKAITQKQLEDHRRNDEPLFLPPKYVCGSACIFVRFDADAHQNEPDAQALIQWVNAKLGGKLYVESSPHGWSGYARFELPIYNTPVGPRTLKKYAVNKLLDDAERALKIQCKAAGFAAGIEIKGRYNLIGYLDDDSRKLIYRGSTCRLPRCPNDDADIDKLIDAKLPISALDILNTTLTAPAPAPLAPTPPTLRKHRSKTRSNHVADAGDKHKNRCRCVSLARRKVIGKDSPGDATETELSQIKELANTLYEQNGLAGHERDEDRNKAFDRIIKHMVRTHDPSVAGEGLTTWFDIEIDVGEAEELIRSTLSVSDLQKLNDDYKPKMDGAAITYHTLALSLVTIIKNNATTGANPTAALQGMLRYYLIRTNGSHAAVIYKTLTDLGLVKQTRKSYKPGVWCRKYAPAGAALDLTYARHLEFKADEVGAEVGEAQATAYILPSGGAKITLSIYSLLPSIKYSSYPANDSLQPGEILFGSWREQIDAVAKEYASRGLI